MKARPNSAGRKAGFTLIELLTVVAAIGVLVALMFPAVRAAKNSVNRARTKVQFAQWSAAIESYRREYGRYPDFHSTGLVNPVGQNTSPSTLHLFHDILAARRRDGNPLPMPSGASNPLHPEAQNRRLIAFHAFNESDLVDGDSELRNLVRDASGNTEIAVLVDRDLDGVIRIGADGDYSSLPMVGGAAPSADMPPGGLRAGVVFYAPAPTSAPGAPEFVFSWK